MWRARLCLEPFDPAAALAAFAKQIDAGTGAVVTFTGLARGANRNGLAVETLFLQHHARLTQRSLDEIAAAGAERFNVAGIDLIHRAGAIAPGEAIVWVAAAAAHRRAAFEAADYLMDRLKTEALFWKREDGADGSTWVEPTDDDHRERARWS
ncbi:molybdenum cofactor biosynthesis protein MoaE [Sphingomonas sp. BN140010]|uniref:Molybdopterin synthase catalytic subunit n=1 Tax=Sphingomonas arvum TaxID=2992113 RepID=A0ABT3JBN1_9SPHN|nr:molybdenum cofactor biosynthesis protein MoaE [Sphingomonas sp. BN140010]MCW3796324.1 molybdenum cofactor biosynthesis protein MoaE [Sphingomonas sp. BN140010]